MPLRLITCASNIRERYMSAAAADIMLRAYTPSPPPLSSIRHEHEPLREKAAKILRH